MDHLGEHTFLIKQLEKNKAQFISQVLLCVSPETRRGSQRFLLAFGELPQNKVKVCRRGHSIEDVRFVWDEQL